MDRPYRIVFSDRALKHMELLERRGRKADFEKVERFLAEIAVHPRTGTGHPERLRHRPGDVWSRAVNKKG